MIHKKDFLVIGILSILISMTGFILDINERVQNLKTNDFEIIMMAGLIYGVIFIPYYAIKLLTKRLGKHKY
jgi:Kef-type K+ transport system membrane component KefB